MTEKTKSSKEVATKKKSAKQSTRKSISDEKIKESLELKLKEKEDRYLRLSAEFDNFRKRTLREKSDLIKFAGEEILVGLLPVMDNFERALQSVSEGSGQQSVTDGIKLIYTKFSDFLEQQGVQEIDSLNKDFDTDCHEAITKIKAPQKKLKGKVVDVIEKGYLLNGKVIRYSKVIVGE